MKKITVLITAILLTFSLSVYAQHQHRSGGDKSGKSSMMQEKMTKQGDMMEMMQGKKCPMCGHMMNQNMPMKKYGMMVNHLPNMQQQLSLTDDQVNQLFDLQTEFKKQQLDYQSELRKKQMKLKSLLADKTSASQVKNQMKDCSETKIDMKIAAYETAGKMKAVLNNDQKQQMKNMMMQQGRMMNHGHDGMMQNQNNQ
jgi:uncharacterized protein YxeA